MSDIHTNDAALNEFTSSGEIAVDPPQTADPDMPMEELLGKIEVLAGTFMNEAKQLTTIASRIQKLAKTGDLKALQKAAASAGETGRLITGSLRDLDAVKDFDFERKLAAPTFLEELASQAQDANVKVQIAGMALLAFPERVTVNPADLSVTIGTSRVANVRPSVLVARMRVAAERPVRFKADAFIELLFRTYLKALPRDVIPDDGFVIPLIEIHESLTPISGQAKEYPLQVFARDIYLLDESGITSTKSDYRLSLPSSTGTRSKVKALEIITKDGSERVYYGIAFSRQDRL